MCGLPVGRAAMCPFVLAVGVLMAAAGCASTGFERPVGPAVPVPDAVGLWQRATTVCRSVHGYQAQLRLSGRVAGRRIPGLTVGLALTDATQVGMEVRAGGPALFVLGGRAERATLLLTQDRRSVTAPAEAIVEALMGVALAPSRLLALLTGCLSPTATAAGAVAYETARVTAVRLTGGDEAFLVTSDGRPLIRAGVFDGLRVDYARAPDGWPSMIDIRSETGREPAVALSMRVETMRIDPALPDSVFTVVVPDGVTPLSIEQLRAAGPLGEESRGR